MPSVPEIDYNAHTKLEHCHDACSCSCLNEQRSILRFFCIAIKGKQAGTSRQHHRPVSVPAIQIFHPGITSCSHNKNQNFHRIILHASNCFYPRYYKDAQKKHCIVPSETYSVFMQLMKNCIADFLSEKWRYLDSCYFCSSSFFFFILDFFDHVHRYGFSSRSLNRRMVFA